MKKLASKVRYTSTTLKHLVLVKNFCKLFVYDYCYENVVCMWIYGDYISGYILFLVTNQVHVKSPTSFMLSLLQKHSF